MLRQKLNLTSARYGCQNDVRGVRWSRSATYSREKNKMNYVTHFNIAPGLEKTVCRYLLEMEYEGVKFYFIDNQFSILPVFNHMAIYMRI